MEKFLNFVFAKYGFIKLIIAFVVLGFSLVLSNTFPDTNFWAYLGFTALGYIVLTFLIMFIYAGINTFNDIFRKKE